MLYYKVLILLVSLSIGAFAAPLANGDFTQPLGTPGWRFVTASNNGIGGGGSGINTGVGNVQMNAPSPASGFLGLGSILGLRMQTQVNAAINAVQPGAANLLNANALVGILPLTRGSFIYQTFDTLSGNAGNVVEYIYSATLSGNGQAFAYFFDIDNSQQTLVSLTSGLKQTGSFSFGSSTRMLVGFGVTSAAGGNAASLTLEQVSQMPELDPGSATLPVAICFLFFFVVVERRRRQPGCQAA